MDAETLKVAWKLAEDFKLGLYEHYKGGRYSAIGIVTHHDTRMPMVLYVSHTYGGVNVRPLVGWTGEVSDPDGFHGSFHRPVPELGLTAYGPRFTYIGPLPSDVPIKDR